MKHALIATRGVVLGAGLTLTGAAYGAPVLDVQALVMQAYTSGKTSVTLPTGTYQVNQPTGSSYHLNFANLSNFTINGTGTTLIYSNPQVSGMHLANATNVTVNGLTIDYVTPNFTQGQIVNLDPKGVYFDLAVDAGYPQALTSKTLFPASLFISLFDPATMKLKVGGQDIYSSSVTQLNANTFRINTQWGYSNARVGDLFAIRELGGSSTHIDNSSNVTLNNYTIYTGGFGIFETYGAGGHHYNNVRLTYGPTPAGATRQRLMSTMADALHSVAMRKGPTISGCLFEGQNDDGTNIHGSFSLVESASGTTMVIGSQNHNPFVVGDILEIADANGYYKGSTTVTAVTPMAKTYVPAITSPAQFNGINTYTQLTLSSSVNAHATDIIWDQNANGSGFVIKNSTYRNNRARGMLIKADNGQILNNTIDGPSMHGIMVDPEFPQYNESGFAQNLTISGNLIENTGRYDNNAYNGLYLSSQLPGPTLISIAATSNTFAYNYGIDVHAQAVQFLTISNNNFAGKTATQKGMLWNFPGIPSIYMTNVNVFTIAGNTYPAGQVQVTQGPWVYNNQGPDIAQVFDASAAFSAAQGPFWLWQSAAINADDWLTFNSFTSAAGWWENASYNYAAGGIITGYRMIPGYQRDPVSTFVAPTAGTAVISAGYNGSASGSVLSRAGGSSDGARIGIWINNQQIWPGDPWVVLVPGQPFTFAPFNVQLNQGDQIHFRVNMNGNASSDDVRWNPVVTFHSTSN